MFDERSESTGMNHTSAESLNHGGENAKKNDFELVKPLPRNLHVYPAKFDEFSRQSFTFSKLIIFSVKGHEVLKNLSKVKSKTFDFTGENDKFNQGNKERGLARDDGLRRFVAGAGIVP